jgi:aldose 1-epimerase
MGIVEIAASGWTLQLLPANGGAIGALRLHGRDILRPTSTDGAAGLTSPLATSCFPLLPFANRIAWGRFDFEGRTVVLRRPDDYPHSLHGLGWTSAWDVTAATDAAITLTHVHDADDRWPWSYHAEQHFALGEQGLAITLTLTNRSTEAMPASIGLHPYFPVTPAMRLRFHSERVWLTDAELLPTHPAPADAFGDWRRGDALPDYLVDNSYDGWNGTASLTDAGAVTTIAAPSATHLHLFAPSGLGFCCVEPCSALPDALNRGGATVLQPGERMELTMRIDHRITPPSS